MTKSEFVDQVADRAGLSKKDAGDAVDAFLGGFGANGMKERVQGVSKVP